MLQYWPKSLLRDFLVTKQTFKNLFVSSPPPVILKDVSYSIMSELLQFMYQGEVNVKQAELQQFMSIAESLQIKGLATNTNCNDKIYKPINNPNLYDSRQNNQHHFNSNANHSDHHQRPVTSTPLSVAPLEGKKKLINFNNHKIKYNSLKVKIGDSSSSPMNTYNQKRSIDQVGSAERQHQMKHKRMDDKSDGDLNDSIENMTSDDIFLPAMHPHVTINESPRYDTSSVKRENNDLAISQPHSPSSFKGSYRMSNRKLA